MRRTSGVWSACAEQSPSWGSTVFTVADGWAIFSGRGLFVNQVMSAGLGELITDSEIDQVAEQATVLGVSPAFGLCEITRPEVVALLSKHGWQRRDQRVVLVHDLRSIAKPVEGIDVALPLRRRCRSGRVPRRRGGATRLR